MTENGRNKADQGPGQDEIQVGGSFNFLSLSYVVQEVRSKWWNSLILIDYILECIKFLSFNNFKSQLLVMNYQINYEIIMAMIYIGVWQTMVCQSCQARVIL